MKSTVNKLILLTTLISFGAIGCAPQLGREVARTGERDPEVLRAETEFISANNIEEAQRVLQSQGYDPGAIDGQMDRQTEQALRQFQQFNRIEATGVLDRPTVDALAQSGARFTGQLGALRYRAHDEKRGQ